MRRRDNRRRRFTNAFYLSSAKEIYDIRRVVAFHTAASWVECSWHSLGPIVSAAANLVIDGRFDRGLTNTSTHWEEFIGFTYLLPHRLW